MSIAALAISMPVIIVAFFLPDLYLSDKQNLIEDIDHISHDMELQVQHRGYD